MIERYRPSWRINEINQVEPVMLKDPNGLFVSFEYAQSLEARIDRLNELVRELNRELNFVEDDRKWKIWIKKLIGLLQKIRS